MTTLSREARALIRAAEGGDALDPERRRRLKRTLLASVAAGGAASLVSAKVATGTKLAAGAGASAAAGASGVAVGAKTLAVVLLVCASSYGVVHTWGGANESAPSVELVAPAASLVLSPLAPERAFVPSEPEPLRAEPPELEERPNVAPAPPVAASKAKAEEAASPPPLPSLADEMQVVREAQRALQTGDAEAALALLEANRARYPEGAMVAEREAARVVALCEAGREAEGRAALEVFMASFPESPYRARLAAACADPKAPQ